MKVLFVCSGNAGISPIVQAQAASLTRIGVSIDYFQVIGKGIWGYLRAIPLLKGQIKGSSPEVVHAHYSFCGIVACLASKKSVVCSLMGSDVNQSGLFRYIITFFIKHVWARTIVKSEDMKNKLGMLELNVIPNGVDLEMFKPMVQQECRKRLAWDIEKKIVLFAADPSRLEKNYSLAQSSVERISFPHLMLICVHGINHQNIPVYLNACDVLLLTSRWEGSPNVVKEAMACGTPIVCTDVGDVRWLFEGLDGCFVSSHDSQDVTIKLELALQFTGKTKGRERLIELGLDSENVAKKIVRLYEGLVYAD